MLGLVPVDVRGASKLDGSREAQKDMLCSYDTVVQISIVLLYVVIVRYTVDIASKKTA